jgi:hypothetical protein
MGEKSIARSSRGGGLGVRRDIGFLLYVEFAFLMYLLELFFYSWNADKKFTWWNVVMLLSRQRGRKRRRRRRRRREKRRRRRWGPGIYLFVWV